MTEIGTSFKLPDDKIIDKSFEAYFYRGVFVFMKEDEIVEVRPKDSFSEVKLSISKRKTYLNEGEFESFVPNLHG